MSRKGPDIICSMDEDVCKIYYWFQDYMETVVEKGPAKEEKIIDFAFATVALRVAEGGLQGKYLGKDQLSEI